MNVLLEKLFDIFQLPKEKKINISTKHNDIRFRKKFQFEDEKNKDEKKKKKQLKILTIGKKENFPSCNSSNSLTVAA